MASLTDLQNFAKRYRLTITNHPFGSPNYLVHSSKSFKTIKHCVDEYNMQHGTYIRCWNDRSKDATFIS